MKKTMFLSAPLFLLLFFGIIIGINGYKDVKSRCKQISGIVTAIYEDGTRDAVFKIQGQDAVFYINRGLEKTFSISGLLEKLKGKQVNILYADNFTPLGSIAECRHISELSTDQEMVYSEFAGK